MKRGSLTKTNSKLVALWIPQEMAAALNEAVKREDTDRSKFIRRALRNQFHKLNVAA
jgi:metal-responsive CopG/Arc/MetJ family transcriptional regulator